MHAFQLFFSVVGSEILIQFVLQKEKIFLPIVHQSENFQRFHVFEISSFVIYSFFFLFCGLCKLTEFFLETKIFWTKKLLWNFKYYIIGNFCIPKKNGVCTYVTTYYYYYSDKNIVLHVLGPYSRYPIHFHPVHIYESYDVGFQTSMAHNENVSL